MSDQLCKYICFLVAPISILNSTYTHIHFLLALLIEVMFSIHERPYQ